VRTPSSANAATCSAVSTKVATLRRGMLRNCCDKTALAQVLRQLAAHERPATKPAADTSKTSLMTLHSAQRHRLATCNNWQTVTADAEGADVTSAELLTAKL
jgi:hypothetical protein